MRDACRSFEMSISRSEFLRLLSKATGGVPMAVEGDVFTHAETGRKWCITLRSLPELRAGSLRLERLGIDWRFSGYEQEEREAIVRRFELHFRRGGG